MIVIDGANLLLENSVNNMPNLENLNLLIDKLGNNFELIIVIKSYFKYKINKFGNIKDIMKNGLILEIPNKFDDDKMILQIAYDNDAMILSNDYYRQYEEYFPKNWIIDHRIAFVIFRNEIYLTIDQIDVVRQKTPVPA